MCRAITCPTCARPTYAGCGNHVEQVLADVPTDERCRCDAPQRKQPSMLARLTRRRR